MSDTETPSLDDIRELAPVSAHAARNGVAVATATLERVRALLP